MKKTIGLGTALGLVLAALVVGAGAGWALQMYRQLHLLESVALAHELEATGLCAGSLTLSRAGDAERLARLLEQRLDSAVAQASALADRGVPLLGPSPNLHESVRRAARYYGSVGAVDQQQEAEALLAKLQTKDWRP